MSQQKYPKAYEAYQQAVYRDGKNPTFWCSIGVLYYQINQYRDALDAYSRAIRLNPYISEVWYDLGTLVCFQSQTLAPCRALTCYSMRVATTKSPMLWMPTNEQLSLTPTTPTLRQDYSFFVLVAQTEALLLLLLNPPMFTLKLTRRLAPLALNGEDQPNSHRLLVHHHHHRVQERTGRADSPTSTLHLSHQTPMKPEVVSNSVEDQHHHCGNQALNKSSFANPTTILAEVAHAVAKLPLPLLAISTLNRLMLLLRLSLLPRPRSVASQTLAGLEQYPQHQHQHLHRTTSMVPTVLTVWHLSDPPTALALMVDPSTTTACLHLSRLILSTKHLHYITSIPRCLPLETRMVPQDQPGHHHHRPRLLWLRLLCRGWMTGRLRLDLRGCESGRRNLLPRSRPTKRTVFALMTFVTEECLHHLATTTAVTRLKPDVLRMLAGLKSHVAKSLADPNQLLVMPRRAIILPMLLTTLPVMLLVLAICLQCSKDLQLPCPELFTRSHQL
jgi:tetratricopeptide (TPR) repeat protein